MNLAQLWTEIEEEQAWRQDELRFFMNQAAALSDDQHKDQFRRSLVLLLYAHFEGFCVFALRHFAKAVNSEALRCQEAQPALGAASLAIELAALRDPSSKCDEFRNTLPDDSQLHRFARDREFVEKLNTFFGRSVRIPDEVVDSESNLKPVVLRKNLYRLGLPYDLFADVEGNIHQLLNLRNKIAHGESRAGIDHATYERVRSSVYFIIATVKREIMSALSRKAFRKPI